VISTVLLAEDMGLEPKEALICPCFLLSALALKTLEFQGVEAVSLAVPEIGEM